MYTHTIAAVVAALIAGGTAWKIQDGRISEIERQHVISKLEAVKDAEAKFQRIQEVKDEALQQAQLRAIKNQRAADGARSELDRLRDDIAAANRAPASCPASADTAATARTLLAQCAARYSELARKADAHASDALTCHSSWPQ
jgi:hypothetical protein